MAWTYESISKIFSEIAKENYKGLVKSFLAMELDISHQPLLDSLYDNFMAVDEMPLISEQLIYTAENSKQQLREELTDLLDKLYRTGEGASFVMECIVSNNISETISHYSDLDGEDYSTLTLESLQELIQKDLALKSQDQDYFGDLTLLALQKDLLDQKSHFLQHYVASLINTMPKSKDQNTLVLD